MSTQSPTRPADALSDGHFAIVASQYNSEFTEGLVRSVEEELRVLVGAPRLTVHLVPGAFEIPLLVREVLSQPDVDAVIALGLILRGETVHADFIGRAVTDSLARLMLEYAKPVIHEVLLVENEAQARARCLDPDHNRGTEAARTAVATLQSLRQARNA